MFINLLACKGKVIYKGEKLIVGKAELDDPTKLDYRINIGTSIWQGGPQSFTRPNHPEFIVILRKGQSMEIDSDIQSEIRKSVYDDEKLGEFWQLLRSRNWKVGIDRRRLYFSVFSTSPDEESNNDQYFRVNYRGIDGGWNQPSISCKITNDDTFEIAGESNIDKVNLTGIGFGTFYDVVHYNINHFEWATAKKLLLSRLKDRIADIYVVIPSTSAPNSLLPVITDEAPQIGTVDDIMSFCGLSNRKGSKIETLIQGFQNMAIDRGEARKLTGKRFLLTYSTQLTQSPAGFKPSDAAYRLMPYFKVLATQQDKDSTVHMLVEMTDNYINDTVMNLYSLLDTSKRMVYTKMVAVEAAAKAIEAMKKANS